MSKRLNTSPVSFQEHLVLPWGMSYKTYAGVAAIVFQHSHIGQYTNTFAHPRKHRYQSLTTKTSHHSLGDISVWRHATPTFVAPIHR